MVKFRNPLIILVLTAVSFLLFNACDAKKGSLDPNTPPTISITDYFGADEVGDVGDPQIFQQTINWSAYDPDGVVKGFSFRVLNADNVPIPTPGYEVLDDEGWVKHYTPNANQTIPLEQSDETTIWLSKQGLESQANELYQTFVTINFPAADEFGDSTNIISQFQVRCIDNGGEISNIASKYFNGFSDVPQATVQSSKGIINGETIGQGVVFEFSLPNNPDVSSASTEAYYFQYKLEKRDLNGEIIPEDQGGYPDYADDNWPDTYGQDPNNILTITSETPITLSTNFDESGEITDSTFLYVRGVNIAGVQTETSSISFLVSDQFRPGSIIYYGNNSATKNDVYALGDNHYALYLDESLGTLVSSIETFSGLHYATPMWLGINEEGEETTVEYQLVGSDDVRVYMHWGWHGEFEEDNPFKKITDETLDEATNSSYFAEITHFDLRLDGAPLYYPPLPPVGDNLVVDQDGTEWLRVPINHPIGQYVTLNATMLSNFNGSVYGEHNFEVRARDLQGLVDPTPDVFTFNIYEPVSKDFKEGILVIDQETHNPTLAPEEYINDFYDYVVSDFTSEEGPDYLDWNQLKEYVTSVLGLYELHFTKSVISPVRLQQYKTIIFHVDNPTYETSFWREYEAFEIFLSQGGNIILSGGAKLPTLQSSLRANGFPLLNNYFGIPLLSDDVIVAASDQMDENPFFINATPDDGASNYSPISLEFDNAFNPYISDNFNPSFPFIVWGLGPLSYFDETQIYSEVLYRYGCKSVDAEEYPPTQDEYDFFNGLPVALKFSTQNNYNTSAVFGFPLSWMNQEDVKSMMNNLLTEMGH